jgi:uncharacterized integral membrane protein (TIGR00697 family)
MIRVVLVVSAYIAAQMLSDITSLKIVFVAGLSIDAGTFIYPITFTLRDLAHKTLGIVGARTLILTAAVINVIMAFFFWFTAQLPADPSVGPQTAYAEVLSPVWRIVIASIVAEVIAELVDTEVYRLWVERVTTRYQWTRVLVSNAVSVPLDSVIFVLGAFAGRYPGEVLVSIIIANILLKGATTLISLPLIYAVPERDYRPLFASQESGEAGK